MRNILFVLFVLLIASCESLFVKDLELEDIGFEKQLVVQAEISSNSDSVSVFVSENESVLVSYQDVKFLSDASVRLLFDGSEITDFAIGADGRYHHVFGDNNRKSGKYQLIVDNPKYSEVVGETEIPADVLIKDLKITANVGYDALEMSDVHEVSFTVEDQPGKDYYSFEVFGESVTDTFIFNEDTTIYEQEPYVYGTMSLDPSVSQSAYGDNVFIDDSFFDGKDYTVKYRFVVYNSGISQEVLEEKFKIRWKVDSEDAHLYKQSLDSYYSSSDFGPFSEPVSVHTNIEGGLGVFYGSNTTVYGF